MTPPNLVTLRLLLAIVLTESFWDRDLLWVEKALIGLRASEGRVGILIVYPGEERSLAFPHELHGFIGQLSSLVVFMISLHLERTECLLVFWMLIVVAQAYFVERIPNFAQLIVVEEMVFTEHPGPIAALL